MASKTNGGFRIIKRLKKPTKNNRELAKNLILYAAVFLIFLSILATFYPTPGNVEEKPFSEILTLYKEGQIQKIEVEADNLSLTLKDGKQIKSRKESGSSLTEALQRSGLREIYENRSFIVIQYVERRQICMHQPGLVQLFHIIDYCIKKFLWIVWDVILQFRRNYSVIADKLKHKNVVGKSRRSRDVYICLPRLHQIPEFPLHPCKDYISLASFQVRISRIVLDVVAHPVKIACFKAVNLDHYSCSVFFQCRKNIAFLAD